MGGERGLPGLRAKIGLATLSCSNALARWLAADRLAAGPLARGAAAGPDGYRSFSSTWW